MIKKDDKKGQFYLIAAIVIIMLISGIFFITNSSTKKTSTRVPVLREELQTESSKILDLGAITGNYRWNDFTKNFTDYAGKDVAITYLIGNQSSFEAFNYTNGIKTSVAYTNTSSPVIVTIQLNNLDYKFLMRKGQNFYFIIVQNINGEVYIETNSV
jgi:hypothetical protein